MPPDSSKPRPQVGGDRLQQAVERDRLHPQLADPRVDQHRVDELAGTLVGVTQQAEHVGLRGLFFTTLEEGDQDRHVRQRLAQVMGDDVGEAA